MSDIQERLLHGIQVLTEAFEAPYITDPAANADELRRQQEIYRVTLAAALEELRGVAEDAKIGDFPVETASSVADLLGDVARTLSHFPPPAPTRREPASPI